jgi:lipid-A-disaccharide synthase
MNSNKASQTFFIVAGETSGDMHGAGLISEIKRILPESNFIGHGGDKMIKSGLEVMHHIDNLAVMGFSEIVKHIPFLLNVMGDSLGKLREIRPDRIILIDYPGFNLRLAKNCNGLNIPITYFILPQLWAWKEKRIQSFHKYIDQSLSIFPFEQDWFETRGVPTSYIGHPFSDILHVDITKEQFLFKHNILNNEPILTLLPGSRQQEVDKHLPIYLSSARALQQNEHSLKILIAKAPGINMPKLSKDILVEEENIRAAISYAKASITTSGTASLECAVLDTPQIVCYKLSKISGFIANQLNNSPFISMANLVAGKKVVPELIQNDVNKKQIVRAVQPLLSNSNERKKMLEDFNGVRRTLGLPGAYTRAAEAIIKRTIDAKP